MMELQDILFYPSRKRSNELEEKSKDEKYVTTTMIVESTIHLQEIQNLKKKIEQLEGKKPHIDPKQSAKKIKIQEKYKVEIESMFSGLTIFEIEEDLPIT